MAIRLLGLTDEARLEIEEATGIKTEGVKLLIENSVEQANILAKRMMDKTIREVQEVIGPHGAVTRLQAGGVRITGGEGVGVYEDGVLKTTIEADGDLFVGSNIESPATTSLSVFVNAQNYNGESMGAGDLLIGDNSADTSNVFYDASEGQLQFRLGRTVNVYMDTDGTLKAGGGSITLDDGGMLVSQAGDAISFSDDVREHRALVLLEGADNGESKDKFSLYSFARNASTNYLPYGDFSSGDLTGWTETDPGSKLSVIDSGESRFGYVLSVASGSDSTNYIQQNLSQSLTEGYYVTFYAKSNTSCFVYGYSGSETDQARVYTEWRKYYLFFRDGGSYLRLYADTTFSNTLYIDDIEVYSLTGNSFSKIEMLRDIVNIYPSINLPDTDGVYQIGGVTVLSGSIYPSEVLSANRTYYVRTDGSDSNDGLTNSAGGAFLTIQKAMTVAGNLNANSYTVTISVADGTYAGAMTLATVPLNASAYSLTGNTGTPANVVLSHTDGVNITATLTCPFTISGFKFTGATYGIHHQGSGEVRYLSCDFANGGSAYQVASDGPSAFLKATGAYSITAGGDRHFDIERDGYLYVDDSFTITLTGTPAFSSFITTVSGGGRFPSANPFSGSATGARHNLTSGGVLRKAGPTDYQYFPGDSEGLVDESSVLWGIRGGQRITEQDYVLRASYSRTYPKRLVISNGYKFIVNDGAILCII
jgi:hypothetical protein